MSDEFIFQPPKKKKAKKGTPPKKPAKKETKTKKEKKKKEKPAPKKKGLSLKDFYFTFINSKHYKIICVVIFVQYQLVILSTVNLFVPRLRSNFISEFIMLYVLLRTICFYICFSQITV